MLDSVVIDGREYAFPIRMGDLSEKFSYSVMDCAADELAGTGYVGILTLNYNGVSVSSACFESDTPDIDDDTVINKLIFTNDTNDYMPQITVGGIDVHNADVREVNRVYGYNSEEYGYLNFPVKTNKGVYRIKLNKSGGISWLSFTDKDSKVYENEFDRDIINYTDTVNLPENYSIEEDKVNSEMKYIPLPEKNEEYIGIINMVEIGEEPLHLPCTLNALMSRCGEMQLFVEIFFTPGRPIGDSQVIKISSYSAKKLIDELDIEGKNSFGFNVNELDDERYDLTNMKYNNVSVRRKEFTISYWSENTEER